MSLATQSSTQVYSPFGSYVVERHSNGDERRFDVAEPTAFTKAGEPARFENADLPTRRKAGDVLSNEQAAVALKLQRYYQLHSVGSTPARLQTLLNELIAKADAGGR